MVPVYRSIAYSVQLCPYSGSVLHWPVARKGCQRLPALLMVRTEHPGLVRDRTAASHTLPLPQKSLWYCDPAQNDFPIIQRALTLGQRALMSIWRAGASYSLIDGDISPLATVYGIVLWSLT